MGKLSIFQMIILAVFVLAAVGGVIALGVTGGGGGGNESVQVTAWGTLPAKAMASASKALGSNSKIKFSYTEKDQNTIESDLVEALASGKGPDLVILPHDMIYSQIDRIFLIPYQSYNERSFRDTFVEEGEMYLFQGGTAALPIVVDPLVMYWNRDIFSEKGESVPPGSWDDFINLVKVINQKDEQLNITKSAVALGEYGNINNSKEILSTMLMQAGLPIVAKTADQLKPSMSGTTVAGVKPGEAVVNYFTAFANPVGPVYSWNRALPDDRSFFISGNLAVYFGFSSEINYIRDRNPHLNFDLAEIPRPRQSKNIVTFGKLYGVSVIKTSKRLSGAIIAAGALTRPEVVSAISLSVQMSPARRDLLIKPPANNPYDAIIYRAGIQSRGWVDPSRSETDAIFQKMIEDVISGKKKTKDALSTAESEMLKIIRESTPVNVGQK